MKLPLSSVRYYTTPRDLSLSSARYSTTPRPVSSALGASLGQANLLGARHKGRSTMRPASRRVET
jgi:hypothetical protein